MQSNKASLTKNWDSRKRAFGLIEVLVSSGIIAMVAASGLVLANFIVHQTASFANREVASWLASEALEQVRVWRDSNLIDENAGTDWLSLSPNRLNFPNKTLSYKPEISTSDGRITLKTTTGGEKIILNGQDYYRQIEIDPEFKGSSQKALVTVKINWNEAGAEKTLQMSTVLTDYKKGVL